MSAQEEQLARLLRAAAKAPPAALPSVPFGFATRTLAHWQSTHRDGDIAVAKVCHRAVLCAFAAAVVASAFAWPDLTSTPQSARFIEQLSVAASRTALHGNE